jgi:hypothetical protein
MYAGSPLADWVTAIGTVIAAVGTVGTLIAMYRSSRRLQQARSVPSNELRHLLLWLESAFEEIRESEEMRTQEWFRDEARRSSWQVLAAEAGTLVDDRLNSRVGGARIAYLDCISLAGSPGRQEAQRGRAIEGIDSTRQAIERMNELWRKYGRP